MTYTKISIISPSFNQGRFIEDAINSVLNQNYPNFEHIIIDGGSTDNTLDIIRKYPHLTWISEKDEGQSDALNKGFRLATGEILGWLNTDDYYLPGTFSRVNQEFSLTKADAIYADYCLVDTLSGNKKELITQNPSKWMSLFYCSVPSETLFFRRKIVSDGISIEKNFQISMDKEFVSHLFYSGYNFHRVNALFTHFRKHELNKSNNNKLVKSIKLKEGLEIFNRYSGFRLPENLAGFAVYKGFVNYCMLYRIISRFFKIGVYSR